MANLMEDIVSYYTELGIIEGLGKDAFVDTMPEKPNTCVAIIEYPGFPQVNHTDIAVRCVQVCNRDSSTSKARENALDLYNFITTDIERQDLTDERWSLISPQQTPVKLKVDAQGRTYYVFNLNITTYVDYN
jgi:hypothetical protein